MDGVPSRPDTHLPKVKPMNLFLLVSRKCSMSFSLHKHTAAVNGSVWDALVPRLEAKLKSLAWGGGWTFKALFTEMETCH